MEASNTVTGTLILENFKKVSITGRVAFIGAMVVIMKEISLMDWNMVKERGLNLETIQLQIVTRGVTYSTKRMDLAPLNGTQEILTKGISSKTWEKVTARWLGMKGQFTLVIGLSIFRMVMESWFFPMGLLRKVYLKIMSL
jgi:hypothetical protein